ncbi:hypothetical protein ACFQ07_27405, partial [Actinomadura adrarensis]
MNEPTDAGQTEIQDPYSGDPGTRVTRLPARAHVPLLLVADPDEDLGKELVIALSGRGVEVTVCTDG